MGRWQIAAHAHCMQPQQAVPSGAAPAPPVARACCVGLDAAANDRPCLRLEAAAQRANHARRQRPLKPKLQHRRGRGGRGSPRFVCLGRSPARKRAQRLWHRGCLARVAAKSPPTQPSTHTYPPTHRVAQRQDGLAHAHGRRVAQGDGAQQRSRRLDF